jgi:hypothetical protein
MVDCAVPLDLLLNENTTTPIRTKRLADFAAADRLRCINGTAEISLEPKKRQRSRKRREET